MQVTKEIQKVIEATVDTAMSKVNTVAWIDRQKAISQETFRNTEKLLYSYQALKDHIASEEEYMEMINKGKSKSIVFYSTKGVGANQDIMLSDRQESYVRSKNDLDRIEKAIKRVQKRKGYEVIKLRYFDRKEDGSLYAFEEIAGLVAGKNGFSEKVTEKTVRSYRSLLVKEIAIGLFGTDAI